MSDQHDPLAEQYQQHKRHHPAPDKLRSFVLQKNRHQQRHVYSRFPLRQWQLGAAVAIAIFAFVSIWGTSRTLTGQPDSAVDVAIVQYHGFDESSITQPDFRASQIRQFTAYQQRQLIVMSRYQQPATVVATGQSLILSSCDEDIIALSDSLVAALLQTNRIPQDLSPGDSVEIAFNQDGYIIELTTPLPALSGNRPASCAES